MSNDTELSTTTNIQLKIALENRKYHSDAAKSCLVVFKSIS